MEPPDELLVVGRLVAAQGLRGELRVLPLSDFAERFTSGSCSKTFGHLLRPQ